MTHLSRVTLRQDPAISAIVNLIAPDRGDAVHAGHHLTWSLFNRGQESQCREFLFREAGRGEFYVLSEVRPTANAVLDVETRELPLVFKEGDRLAFQLRANPTIKRGNTRIDVVMRELHVLAPDVRRQRRAEIVQTATMAWLQRQGETRGFAVDEQTFIAESYTQHRIARRAARPISISTVDLSGILTVTDPTAFAEAVRRGIGSARAYGCGLILVRTLN
jgi:CRISPR system Cascade subunit CasE